MLSMFVTCKYHPAKLRSGVGNNFPRYMNLKALGSFALVNPTDEDVADVADVAFNPDEEDVDDVAFNPDEEDVDDVAVAEVAFNPEEEDLAFNPEGG